MAGIATQPAAAPSDVLPSFASRVDRIAAAEMADGWLAECIDERRYLLPCRELVESLAGVLGRLDGSPCVEICAGRGELAESLASLDVHITATDVAPPEQSRVLELSARDALGRLCPTVVLGCFVPIDAMIDEAVLAWPGVRHYVVLGARVAGEFGSDRLRRATGWTCRELSEVSRWMLTRHDLWTGQPRLPVLQRGEAWCFSREDNEASFQ